MGNVAGSRMAAYGDARVGERRGRVRRSGRIFLDCNCGERFTLAGRVAVRGYDDHGVIEHWEARSLEEERRYSWLEDRLEWLEGKEAREEYYARLEQAASW